MSDNKKSLVQLEAENKRLHIEKLERDNAKLKEQLNQNHSTQEQSPTSNMDTTGASRHLGTAPPRFSLLARLRSMITLPRVLVIGALALFGYDVMNPEPVPPESRVTKHGNTIIIDVSDTKWSSVAPKTSAQRRAFQQAYRDKVDNYRPKRTHDPAKALKQILPITSHTTETQSAYLFTPSAAQSCLADGGPCQNLKDACRDTERLLKKSLKGGFNDLSCKAQEVKLTKNGIEYSFQRKNQKDQVTTTPIKPKS